MHERPIGCALLPHCAKSMDINQADLSQRISLAGELNSLNTNEPPFSPKSTNKRSPLGGYLATGNRLSAIQLPLPWMAA